MRAHYHPIVLNDMEGYKTKYKINPTKFKFELSTFLQKFSIYKGI